MIDTTLGEQAGLRKRPPRMLPPGRTIGAYVTAQMVQPFAATLLVILPALLLERLLRLFDVITNRGVPGSAVAHILVDLVPHYLGLALPAALFAGVYVVVSRLNASSELDAMLSLGVSLRWISLPFIVTGLLTMLIGFGLYNYAQPYARYAYRAAFQAAVDGSWDASVPAGEITVISPDLVVTADRSDRASGKLRGALIYQRDKDGEKIVTAPTGRLLLTPKGDQLLLTLDRATRMDVAKNGQVGWLTAATVSRLRPFVIALKAFRARGLDEREMTLGELWAARQARDPALGRERLDGELHGRLVRCLSLALLPLFAVPFGLAARRSRRSYGLVVGLVILVLYYHVVELTQSFGTAGFLDPRPLLWAAFLVFAAICLAMFRRAELNTAEGPLDTLLDGLNRVSTMVPRLWHGARRRSL